jgi:hypothetical protein
MPSTFFSSSVALCAQRDFRSIAKRLHQVLQRNLDAGGEGTA